MSDRQTEWKAIKDRLLLSSVNACPGAFLLNENHLTSAALFSPCEKITGGIYIARVKETVKSLNACFVEIAKNQICFLAGREMEDPCILNRSGQNHQKDNLLKQGDLVLVQGLREAQKTKQPAVTAKISLSNPCFAISFGSVKTGFSTKLSKDKKEEIRRILNKTPYFDENGALKPLYQIYHSEDTPEQAALLQNVPAAGLIARTECGLASEEEILRMMEDLLREFRELLITAFYRNAYTCLRSAPRPWQDALTNLVMPGAETEIVTDDPALYREIADSGLIKPPLSLRLYEDSEYPLEKMYGLGTKLKEALGTRVWLKSGAYLVIEPTEALTVIDVNSGKYESRRENASFIRSVNFEAADEIARQLRLRNLSGMILVDFINMTSPEDQEELIERVKKNVRLDRIKTSVIDFTKLGLMEITRQKKDAPLAEQAEEAGFWGDRR